MTSEDRKAYTAYLRSAKENEITPTIVRDPKTGDVGYGDKFVRVDSNGEESHAELPIGNKEPYVGLLGYVDSLKSKNDAVLDGGKITSSTDRKSVV